MKKALIRSFALALCLITALSFLPNSQIIIAYANQHTNKDISVAFTVKERNGIKVDDYFFRRGVAFEEGALYSPDGVCLSENGTPIRSDAEVLETYEDGSIRWLLISGVVDLRPGEMKRLTITNGNGPKGKTEAKATAKGITVDGEHIDMSIDSRGITSIKKDGVELLKAGPINLYATVAGKTYYMIAEEFEIMKHTDSYVKLQFKGKLNENIFGTFAITIAEGAERIQIDHRVRTYDDVFIESTGLTIGMKYDGAKPGDIVDSDYLQIGKVGLSTLDDSRFNGAVVKKELTGFIVGETDVKFTPILNQAKNYTWWDGVSRTAHLYLCTGESAKDYATTLRMPPNAFADPEQYVKAGQILTTDLTSLVREYQATLEKSFWGSFGTFEVGMPAWYTDATGAVNTNKNNPGEVDYNFGIAYMQTGNEEIYRMLFDMSEVRADIGVYRGMHKDAVGIMRARLRMIDTGDTFFSSHAYYSDEGGLYMAYCLTGDEWVYDGYKLCIYKTLEDMYQRPTSGTFTPDYTYMSRSNRYQAPTNAGRGMYESRGMIRTRTLYLAGRHFHDDRFTRAAYDLLKWAETNQLGDGDFNQAYYNDGSLLYQAIPEGRRKQPPIKNYVNLMGFRGLSQILDYERNETALKVTLKYADQLCYQLEHFGPILMNPTGDKDKYEVNEDDTRTTDGRATIMGIDVLCTAWEHTKDEKYLYWICRGLEGYIASSVNGQGGIMNDRGYKISSWSIEGQRQNSLLRTSDNLSVIFNENRDKIREMGYEHVAVAMSTTGDYLGRTAKTNVTHPGITHSIYTEDGTRSLFVMSWRPTDVDDPEASWEQDVELTLDGSRLWSGMTNVITNPYNITLAERMDWLDVGACLETGINLDEFSGNAKAEIISNTAERLEFTMLGDFETAISISDGVFNIEDGKGYRLAITPIKGGIRVVVTEGGKIAPVDGKISFVVDSSGNALSAVGLDLFKGTKAQNKAADAPLTRDELVSIVRERIGVDITLKSDIPTWQEFSTQLVGALGTVDSKLLENSGLYVVYSPQINNALSDKEATEYAAKHVDVVYNGDKLSSNVYLMTEGIHGTKIKWTSSREDILSNEGLITRDNIDCDFVTLKAEITKGLATTTKEFKIPLDRTKPAPPVVGPGYIEGVNSTGIKRQTDTFELTFDAYSNFDKVDCLIAFSSSDTPCTSNSDPQYRVRFSPGNTIDSYDRNAFKADETVGYVKNQKFRFRIVFRVKEQTFDAFVTPEGGEEVQIVNNYYRREAAKPVDNIDTVWLWSTTPNAITIENISLATIAPTPMADIFIEDSAGNKFVKGQSLDTFVRPDRTENGRFINWQTIKATAVNDLKQPVDVQLGIVRLGVENLSTTEVFREVKLIPQNITDSSKVTKQDLIRILGGI